MYINEIFPNSVGTVVHLTCCFCAISLSLNYVRIACSKGNFYMNTKHYVVIILASSFAFSITGFAATQSFRFNQGIKQSQTNQSSKKEDKDKSNDIHIGEFITIVGDKQLAAAPAPNQPIPTINEAPANSTTIEAKTTNGESQTAVIDVNGNLKMVKKPEPPQAPAMPIKPGQGVPSLMSVVPNPTIPPSQGQPGSFQVVPSSVPKPVAATQQQLAPIPPNPQYQPGALGAAPIPPAATMQPTPTVAPTQTMPASEIQPVQAGVPAATSTEDESEVPKVNPVTPAPASNPAPISKPASISKPAEPAKPSEITKPAPASQSAPVSQPAPISDETVAAPPGMTNFSQ